MMNKEDINLNDKVASALFSNLWHIGIIHQQMGDLMRLVDPLRMNNNAMKFKYLRDDESKPLQTKMYWHNKIVKIYENAMALTINLNPRDEEYFDLNVADIKKILNQKKEEYEIYTFRNKLLGK